MRRFLGVLLLVSLAAFACDERSTDRLAAPKPERVPDFTTEVDGMTIKFYGSENAYAVGVLSALAGHDRVRADLDRFALAGYELYRNYSFVTDGTRDGRQLEIAVLSLGQPGMEDRDAVYLLCFGGADPFRVVPMRLSTQDLSGVEDAQDLGDGLWLEPIEPFEPIGGWVAYGDTTRTGWNWKRYIRCVGAGTYGGMITCAYQCRMLPPHMYLQCVAICTEGRALGSIIACAILEL